LLENTKKLLYGNPMRDNIFSERIKPNSIWNTTTPMQTAMSLPVYALEGGLFLTYKDYRVERNYHDSFLLLYSVKGYGKVRTENNEYELKENQAIIIDCHAPHEYTAGDDWDFLWLHFKGMCDESFYNLLCKENPGPVEIKDSETFSAVFRTLTDNLRYQNTLRLMQESDSIQKLFYIYKESHILSSENADATEGNSTVNKALEYIHKNYSKDISIEDISSYVNLSKYHFIRVFKHVIGVTPYAYITGYRITMGKHMLLETSLSIEEISHECGFADSANFISRFKTHTGLSPLKYRNEYK